MVYTSFLFILKPSLKFFSKDDTTFIQESGIRKGWETQDKFLIGLVEECSIGRVRAKILTEVMLMVLIIIL